MINKKECIYLQERIYEFLIEPETAPSFLRELWQKHQEECMDCQNIFHQMEREQACVQKNLIECYENVSNTIFSHPKQVLRKTDRRRWKTAFWATAASIMIALGLLLVTNHSYVVPSSNSLLTKNDTKWPDIADSPSKSLEALTEKQLTDIFRGVMEKVQSSPEYFPPKVPARWPYFQTFGSKPHENSKVLSDVIDNITGYIQKTQQEFLKLYSLAVEVQKLQKTENPYFSQQLQLHCRLVLLSPDNIDKLANLEQNGYPVASVKKVFGSWITGIDSNQKTQDMTTDFFQKASPHLLQIFHHRNSLLDSLGTNKIDYLGGKEQTINLLENIETLLYKF